MQPIGRTPYLERIIEPSVFVVDPATGAGEGTAFNVLFVMFLLAVLLVVLVKLHELATSMGIFVMLTFLSRVAIHLTVRELKFFAHEKGGDALQYENVARWISRQWDIGGIRYLTEDDNPWIGKASLPQNVFAMLIHLNHGRQTDLSCTALVAFCLCIAALNFYSLARELGAEKSPTFVMTAAVFSMPSMIYYSADMYKDAIVLALVLGAVGSSIRLSRRYTTKHLIVGLACLFALWFVRFYMVFMAILPMLVGYVGLRSKSWYRPVLSFAVLGVLIVQFAGSSNGQEVSATADKTFTLATGSAQEANRQGGSAVALGKGIETLPIRVVYTLFAPFPWMPGTAGLHLGKIDTLFFWYLLYRAGISVKRLARTDKATLLSLGAFIVPTTLAYAMTMSNIGLMLRQRVPVVVLVALLAVLGIQQRMRAVAPRTLRSRRRELRLPAHAATTGPLPALDSSPEAAAVLDAPMKSGTSASPSPRPLLPR